MLFISEHGIVDDERIKVRIFPNIERSRMSKVNGIVVHQTDSSTANSTFNSYQGKGANGAHFLIDKDGTVYQTASLYRRTNHVGKMQSRCLVTKKCTPAEIKSAFSASRNPSALTRHEMQKDFPARFPSNNDSIGIELVGLAIEPAPGKEKVYESVTDKQNASLRWLIQELTSVLNISSQEIYKHSEIGRKNITEASSAKW
ncbi:peptidoglycan recognition protein family protein [Ralstonia sp. 25C]|uniref:peptidoglycan recognition protein family protein n=1 Tax=Ralstonia sp. 25C TaxID=3447363 RepID=UPI003F754212